MLVQLCSAASMHFFPQVSLFFTAEAATVMQWSRLSDHIGRKPVLLTGLFGLVISMICFGLSRTFWALVVRSLGYPLKFTRR
jgi:MFS family permease